MLSEACLVTPVRTNGRGQPGWMRMDFLTEGEQNLPPPIMLLWHIDYFEFKLLYLSYSIRTTL